MLEAVRVVGRAFRLWWREIGLLTGLNLAWLALQVPIVTGPAATAAMYAVARRIADGEVVGPRTAWQALRQMARPALGWGALNLVLIVVISVNFMVYGAAPGLGWAALRLAWGTLATLAFALNLFYWPFWLAQTDRRMALTWRNALLLYLKAPGFGLTLLIVCALLAAVSVLITLPLAAALMAWLALIGVTAVDAALRRPAAVAPDGGVEMEAL
jgi:uncharacterized membrane protein YesL